MLHEGPCAGAVGSGLAAPDDTEGAERGREMSTSSIHHTPVPISWSHVWDISPGQVAMVATLSPSCSSHWCTCWRSRCTPRSWCPP